MKLNDLIPQNKRNPISDPLITDKSLPLSEAEANLLLIALKELPDDPEEMKALLKKYKNPNISHLKNGKPIDDVMAYHSLLARDSVMLRILQKVRPKNVRILDTVDLLQDPEYEEIDEYDRPN